jgi:hypothetical protein
MDLFCPPLELSPRFAAKIINRANCGELYFPISGVLERLFLSRPDNDLALGRSPGCHYVPESGLEM